MNLSRLPVPAESATAAGTTPMPSAAGAKSATRTGSVTPTHSSARRRRIATDAHVRRDGGAAPAKRDAPLAQQANPLEPASSDAPQSGRVRPPRVADHR